jgi:hypothetical protein
MGNKEETKYAFELSYPLSSGGKDTAGLRKAHADLKAKEEKLDNTRKEVEEKVRNAWQDLLTDKMNAEHLRNSANISAEFLVLARKERKMGTRSLIDVLSEENNYLTSLESAVQAEKDYIVSAFTVLKEIGRLNVSMVQETVVPNAMQKSSYQKADERTVAAVQKDLGEKLAKQAESMAAIAVTAEEAPLPLAQKQQPESRQSSVAAVEQVSALPTSVAQQETESSNAADPWEAVYEKVVAHGWAESVAEVRESVAN